MSKFQPYAVLTTLAASAAIVAPAMAAQARTLAFAPAADRHIVSSTMATPVVFRALPDARCLIPTGGPRAFTVYADDNGFAHFTFQLGRNAVPSVRLVAACDSSNAHVVVPIDIQAVPGPVQTVRPPIVEDRQNAQPHGFNPVTASDADLERYGYPPRPDMNAPAGAYAEWERAVIAGRIRVASTGVFRPDQVHGIVRRDGSVQSSNWSGMVAKGSGTQYTHVVGKWVVPPVSTREDRSPAYSSIWVGLGGYNSSDIVQDGTEQDAAYFLGSIVSSYDVWIEYYPDGGSTELPNFLVSPGDQVYMSAKTCRNQQNQLVGCFYLVNYTQNERTSAAERSPNGRFDGDTAEWILERPQVNGNLYDLPDYNVVETTDMQAYDTTQGKYVTYGNEPFDAVSMVNFNDNDLLSQPTSLSKSTAQFTWKHYR